MPIHQVYSHRDALKIVRFCTVHCAVKAVSKLFTYAKSYRSSKALFITSRSRVVVEKEVYRERNQGGLLTEQARSVRSEVGNT